jgi:hypothetical protein
MCEWKMKRILITFCSLSLFLVNWVFAASLPLNKQVIVDECYDRLGTQTIRIAITLVFGDSGDWYTESCFLKAYCIDGRKQREIGQADLDTVTVPLRMCRVRLKKQEEIAYLILLTGHRSREVVVKITPVGVKTIFEQVVWNVMREEVLDVDGDGIDEIIFHRKSPRQDKENTKEIYKYQNGTFEKIKECPDDVANWYPIPPEDKK